MGTIHSIRPSMGVCASISPDPRKEALTSARSPYQLAAAIVDAQPDKSLAKVVKITQARLAQMQTEQIEISYKLLHSEETGTLIVHPHQHGSDTKFDIMNAISYELKEHFQLDD